MIKITIIWKKLLPRKINTPSKGNIKRLVLSTLHNVGGSMTVEATVIIPIYLFFFLNLIWYIEIFRIHTVMAFELSEIGSEMAMYGYLYDDMDEDDNFVDQTIENIGFSYLYVKNKLVDNVGAEYLDNSPIKGGSAGLNLIQSQIMNNDNEIDIVLTYEVTPFINILGFRPFTLVNRYYSKAFVGYELKENEKEKTVLYYTEKGNVYHLDKYCTYLTRNIKEVGCTDILAMHNKDGGCYTQCSFCEKELSTGKYYITQTGSHYHISRYCSALYRNIRMIEVEEYNLNTICSKCKGGD